MSRSDPTPSAAASDNPASRKGTALPCPFCGGTAGAVFRENLGCYRYRCDCGASPAPVSKLAYLDDRGEPEADAIARWNERIGAVLPAEMTPAIAVVLRLLSFETVPAAHIFRAAGAEIPTRIEDEQAYVLFRFLHLALQLGLDWGREADRLLNEARATAKAKMAGTGAPS